MSGFEGPTLYLGARAEASPIADFDGGGVRTLLVLDAKRWSTDVWYTEVVPSISHANKTWDRIVIASRWQTAPLTDFVARGWSLEKQSPSEEPLRWLSVLVYFVGDWADWAVDREVAEGSLGRPDAWGEIALRRDDLPDRIER